MQGAVLRGTGSIMRPAPVSSGRTAARAGGPPPGEAGRGVAGPGLDKGPRSGELGGAARRPPGGGAPAADEHATPPAAEGEDARGGLEEQRRAAEQREELLGTSR